MRKWTAYLVLILAQMCSDTHAANWAHWRGPTGNGTAPDANPPVEWSNTKNVKWKVAIPGHGLSSPVIWENRVFVTSNAPASGQAQGGLPTMEFKVYCFDRKNGEKVWEQVATVAKPHEKTHDTNSFSSASPCTDGQHVYAHFGSRGLFCYTVDGKFKWKREDFGKMKTLNGFGEGSSPTLEGDKIIVPWDHIGPSALYALDKLTGNTIWMEKRDEPTGWATPLIVEHAGRKQIIMNGQNFARSYDLETGKELWRCDGQTKRPIASPVAANGVVIVGSGFQGAFIGAFRLDGHDDIKNTDKVKWVINHDAPDVASPLLTTSGRLYFHKGKSGQLTCVDAATGKPHYVAQRIEGVDATYASPIAAGGHVYLTGRSGKTTVIQDADELKVVHTNDVGETVSATPAPVDNELFLRGEDHLFCIATP